MPAPGGEARLDAPAPRWEYLVAHHSPDRYRRTLRLSFHGRSIHLCARCSGQLLGFLGVLGTVFALAVLRAGVASPLALAAFALAPCPAAVDWFLQSTKARESTNPVRVTTGALLGAAFGGLLALPLSGQWLYFWGGCAVLFAYVFGIAAALRYRGAWRRVLEEHFPGLELPPDL